MTCTSAIKNANLVDANNVDMLAKLVKDISVKTDPSSIGSIHNIAIVNFQWLFESYTWPMRIGEQRSKGKIEGIARDGLIFMSIRSAIANSVEAYDIDGDSMAMFLNNSYDALQNNLSASGKSVLQIDTILNNASYQSLPAIAPKMKDGIIGVSAKGLKSLQNENLVLEFSKVKGIEKIYDALGVDAIAVVQNYTYFSTFNPKSLAGMASDGGYYAKTLYTIRIISKSNSKAADISWREEMYLPKSQYKDMENMGMTERNKYIRTTFVRILPEMAKSWSNALQSLIPAFKGK
jgi:hypothetical protein